MDILTAEFISSVGFPIGVASYLLLRFEGILRGNTEALIALHETISEMKRPHT